MIANFIYDDNYILSRYKYTEQLKKIIDLNNKYNPVKEINFSIELEPLPYARPRKSIKLGNRMYDPRAAYKKKVKKIIKDLVSNPKFKIALGEVKIEAIFYLDIPKNIGDSKNKLELAITHFLKPLTRPDVDNYLKPIFDSMNGTVYKDDGQVTSVNTVKLYTDNGHPYLHLNIQYREQPIKFRFTEKIEK